MCPTTRSVPIVLFGLLALGAACSSSSNNSGSGGHTPAGASGGGSLSSGGHVGGSTGGGLASGGAGVNGGSSTGGSAASGGTGTAGNTGSAGRSTAGNTGNGGSSTASGGTSTGGGSTSAGGNAGNGGRSTAGSTASSTNSAGGGGTAGNTSNGGSQTGGSGGNAKIDGGADVGPGPDAMMDSGRPDSPADLPQNSDTGSTVALDACFADLPKAVGTQMVATKQTSDNRVRIRLALDTEDRMGTSGTYGWGLIRLAVEVDGEVTCIKDRANLKYTGSHHDCSDTATATSGSTTYSLRAPDRSSTSITIDGSGAANGTWTLTDTTCAMAGSLALPAGCRSGGPC